MQEIYLQPPAAIGDAAMATAHVKSLHILGYEMVTLITRQFICPLWEGIDGARALPPDQVGDVNKIDITAYLGNQFEREHTEAHNVELQAIEIRKQGGPDLNSSPDNAKIVLTEDELQIAAQTIEDISREHGNLPVVIFEPFATTKNRNLPKITLERTAKLLDGRAVCCISQPIENNPINGAITIWEKDLRKSAALLAVANAVVAVDSAPLHMANAALQGSRETMGQLGLNGNQEKVVIALGSSPRQSVAYGNNQVVLSQVAACDIVCRGHGYPGQTESLTKQFDRAFFPSGIEKDKSVCQYPNYATVETAHCMASIQPDLLVAAIIKAI